MKFWYSILFLALVACSEENSENNQKKTANEIDISANEPLEIRAKRHIEANLKIPVSEKYSLKIHKAHLDGDDREDAIITVNRYEFAIDEASKSENPAKKAEMGFMGNYNYIFYFDGGLNKISPGQVVASSPAAELAISFENITSQVYKDILVDYRIRNASYKSIFTVINHTPKIIFQWKNFDGLGTTQKEAYVLKFTEGTTGVQRDIVVLNADFENPRNGTDLYTFTPELIPTKEMKYRFFYVPSEGKYMTKK
jgi:hypothetical protein